MSDITDHAKLIIESSGDVVYPIAIGIKGKQLYAASVNVIGIEGLVDTLNMTFSEFRFFYNSCMQTQIYFTFRYI